MNMDYFLDLGAVLGIVGLALRYRACQDNVTIAAAQLGDGGPHAWKALRAAMTNRTATAVSATGALIAADSLFEEMALPIRELKILLLLGVAVSGCGTIYALWDARRRLGAAMHETVEEHSS